MDDVKQLRDKTGVSIMQCKKALEDASGDMDKAAEILKAIGVEKAAKKANRSLGAGIVASYVHNNDAVAVLVELSCETDFVARNEEFKDFGKDIAMHIAAMNPQYLSEDQMPDGGEQEMVLLLQPFIKDQDKTVRDLVNEATQKFGERVEIQRFVRYAVGSTQE